MARAASSQALARATASAAGTGAAVFAGLADFSAALSSSGACWANATPAARKTVMGPSASHRKRFATSVQSFRNVDWGAESVFAGRDNGKNPVPTEARRVIPVTALFLWRAWGLCAAIRAGESCLERGAEALDDHIDLGRPDNEGRGEE